MFEEPLKDVSALELPSEALPLWLKAGYQDMTAVLVSRGPATVEVDKSRIEIIEKLADSGKWAELESARDRGESSLFTEGNYINAAYQLGIIKRLYWISPSGFLLSADRKSGVRSLLQAFGYDDKTISGFQYKKGASRGKINGLEVIITPPEEMPAINEPVLLVLDTGYFTSALDRRKRPGYEEYISLSRAMYRRKLTVEHVSVAYSTYSGEAGILDRHLGDELLLVLQEPELLNKAASSALWRQRSHARFLISKGLYEEALDGVLQEKKYIGEDAALLAAEAISLCRLKKHEQALMAALDAADGSPGYDTLLLYMARVSSLKDNPEAIENYLKAYLQKRPSDYRGLMELGNYYYDRAKDDLALEAYHRALMAGDYLDAIMYSGDALVHLGRHKEAGIYYERGLEIIDKSNTANLANYPESERNIQKLGIKGLQSKTLQDGHN